jgi:1,4-dihydroxy-6-naphthoate synthase
MKLSLAFSPCPNDTYIFDALVNSKIPPPKNKFIVTLADIEQLNQFAISQEMDIVKISYAVYPLISENYQILPAGSALGYGNGPLLVSKKKIYPDEVPFLKIAIPGIHTTANLLLHSGFASVKNTSEYLFSKVMDAILSNEVDAGVLIHETRFTYLQRGLHLITDLGKLWEKNTGLPVPLGGIAIRRSLPEDTKQEIGFCIQSSLEVAKTYPKEALPYMKKHAQELDEKIIWQHVDMFVNDFTTNLGNKGQEAVMKLLEVSTDENRNNSLMQPIFVK